ncbi:hypothetical protein GCM10007159_06280 [Modicisalibacter luteus]|nr:hypothetical protein GCM10007159_06280 [Halomonas lutea]
MHAWNVWRALTIDTAIAEVRHHQHNYWRNVPDLSYERFVFRGLTCMTKVGLGTSARAVSAPSFKGTRGQKLG